MVDTSPALNEEAQTPAIGGLLSKEALLGVSEICELTGLCPVTAAKLMKETGRCLQLHRRLFVLESSFFNFLHEMEVKQPCNL